MTLPRPALGLLLALACYFFVIFYLQRIDVFTVHFESTGWNMLGYNLSRVAFLGYFSWLLAGTGWLTQELFKKSQSVLSLTFIDRQVLSFFLGAGVLTLILFPLGLLNLYYPATAFLLSVPILVFSYPHLVRTIAEGRAAWRSKFSALRAVSLERGTVLVLLGALGIVAGTLLLTRALYPGECGNDVYEHYLPYQRAVIQNHGLGPNDVWMQFYYSKGAGLTFLAMLLTDDLASQSVHYVMLFAAAVGLYSIVRHLVGSSTWGLLAAVAALACFPFSNPQWGGFQSHHLGVASWLLAMTWFAILTSTRSDSELDAWFRFWAIIAASQAVFFPLSLIFSFPMLGALWVIHRFKTQRRLAAKYLVLLLGTGAVLAGILGLNYAMTGMFSDNPLSLMWGLADQSKFSSWCSTYLSCYFLQGGSEPGRFMPDFLALLGSHLSQGYWIKLDQQSLPFWVNLGRFSEMPVLFPGPGIFLGLMLCGAAAAILRPARVAVAWGSSVPLFLIIAAAVLVASLPGYTPNLYRNFAFMAFFSAAILCLFWKILIDWVSSPRLRPILTAVFILGAASTCTLAALDRVVLQRVPGAPSRWPDFFAFAVGKFSVKEALLRGDGLWQEALSAKARVGVNEKMLCFNNNGFPTARAAHSFPGSGLITEPSRSSFAGLWHVIAFGKAEQARAALEKQGIDFFLIDFNRKFFGCIPFSPLFEPRHLGERFDLVWARGTVCLLTWRGRGTGQIPPEYVDYMSQRVEQWHQRPEDHSDRLFGQQYQSMKALYDFNQGRDYPLKRMQNLLHVHEWE